MIHTHKVMNCQDYRKDWFTKGAASPKLDGVRGYYYPGQLDLRTRQNKLIHGMQHIVQDLRDKRFSWPVDMELYVPGMEFNEISGLVRNHQRTPEVQCHIIDIPSPGFIHERLNRRPAETKNIKYIPHFKVTTHERYQLRHSLWLKDGYEGSVIKRLDTLYTNSRGRDWLRDVPVKSEDCKVLGVYEGNGKMYGIAGGLIIDFRGIECKCGTMKGMTYEDRDELLANEDQYIGQVAEIQYKNLQPTGKPRQPRFKGWRHDK